MFSLMSSSFAYEDPLRRNPNYDTMKFGNKASLMFKEMGRGMWSTGKGFGKVGALYAGLECCVESVSISTYSSPSFLPHSDVDLMLSSVRPTHSIEPKTISGTLSLEADWQVECWLINLAWRRCFLERLALLRLVEWLMPIWGKKQQMKIDPDLDSCTTRERIRITSVEPGWMKWTLSGSLSFDIPNRLLKQLLALKHFQGGIGFLSAMFIAH